MAHCISCHSDDFIELEANYIPEEDAVRIRTFAKRYFRKAE
jgi:hypothetical protein